MSKIATIDEIVNKTKTLIGVTRMIGSEGHPNFFQVYSNDLIRVGIKVTGVPTKKMGVQNIAVRVRVTRDTNSICNMKEQKVLVEDKLPIKYQQSLKADSERISFVLGSTLDVSCSTIYKVTTKDVEQVLVTNTLLTLNKVFDAGLTQKQFEPMFHDICLVAIPAGHDELMGTDICGQALGTPKKETKENKSTATVTPIK